MPAEESATVCVPAPLKVTARELGVNTPVAELRVQLPPTLMSPPEAVERFSVPLICTLPRTTSGAVKGVAPANCIVEPESIVRLPANWKGEAVELFGRSSVVLLLSWTLLG